MKTKTLIIILIIPFLFQIKIGFGQTPQQNLNKYWSYRNRLKSKFMVSISPWDSRASGRQEGINIPASEYNATSYINPNTTNSIASGHYINFGDATCLIGEYLSVLATEYRLLKDYNQSTSNTLNEMEWTLHAYERLDATAECTYMEGGCTPGPLGNYSTPNGFFLRDDVLRDYTVYWTEHGYSNFANVPKVYSGYTPSDDAKPSVTSQDQIWNLLMGLSLIVKLVDAPNTYYNYEGETVTMKLWAQKLAYKMITMMQAQTTYCIATSPFTTVCKTFDIWRFYNPVTGEQVAGSSFGDLLPNAWYFSEAGNVITGQQWGNLHHAGLFEPRINIFNLPFGVGFNSITDAVVDSYEDDAIKDGIMDIFGSEFRSAAETVYRGILSKLGVYLAVKPYNDNAKFILSIIAKRDWGCSLSGVLDNIISCSSYYNSVLPNNTNDVKLFAFEHYPLFYLVLNDEPLTSNNYRFRYYMSFIEKLLNLAPTGGPNRYIQDWNNDNVVDENDYPCIEWSSSDRISKPIGKSITTGEFAGEYNGLDYMILHNLYWLAYKKEFNANLVLDGDRFLWLDNFPTTISMPQYTSVGGTNNQTTLQLNSLGTISADNIIKNQANVVYRAGVSTTLLPGFEVEAGGTILIDVDPYKNITYDQ